MISYLLTVTNGIGTSVETKKVDFEPLDVCMNKTLVFAANKSIVFCWNFRSENTHGGGGSAKFSAIDGKWAVSLMCSTEKELFKGTCIPYRPAV